MERPVTEAARRAEAEPALGSDARLRQEAQRLASARVDQLAYAASHDLQEPLRTVRGYLQLLESRHAAGMPDEAREMLREALAGTARLQAMILDLLEFSRIGARPERFAPTDAAASLGAALANLNFAIEESGAVVTHGELPVVVADAAQLGRVFQNLLANAIKFRKAERPLVHVEAERAPGAWEFVVRDNGIGLDLARATGLFQPFRRLHSPDAYPGTGMGLAICKKIVDAHGGRIWVESRPGEGAAFHFTIPDTR